MNEQDARRRDRLLALLILLAGLTLRVLYAAATPVSLRQHDVYSIAAGKGHAGYIYYFFQNLRLPDFSPMSRSQFYHPPLHHLLAGLFMRLEVGLFRCSEQQALENVQILTVLYSSLTMLVFYRLLQALRLRGRALTLPLALFCLLPGLFFMSGDINNDALMNLLMLAAFTRAVLWYEKPTFGSIALIALWLGLGMMTKLSAVLAAPAIALLFLGRLSEKPDASPKGAGNSRTAAAAKRPRLIAQFALFALIVFPLGLWWSFYGLIRYGVPLAYVPSLSESSTQYVGSYSAWARTLGFTREEFSSVFIAWKDEFGHRYSEYNMLVGLYKTALFDESTLFRPDIFAGTADYARQRAGLFFCRVLFIDGLLLLAASAAACLRLALSGRKTSRSGSALPVGATALLGLTVFLSYLSFCFGYPHTCTMNFRYAVPCAAALFALLGQAMERDKLFCRPAMQLILTVLTAVFAVAACGLVLALQP